MKAVAKIKGKSSVFPLCPTVKPGFSSLPTFQDEGTND